MIEKRLMNSAAASARPTGDAFYVISKFITVEGYDLPLTLEIISLFSDPMTFDRFGNDLLIERVSKEKELDCIDEVTGLYNEDYLRFMLDDTIEKSRKLEVSMTLITFEIVGFEKIFKSKSKQKQEEVLRVVASMIQSNISRRRGDFAAYRGNGRFSAVMLGLPTEVLKDRLKLIIDSAANLPFSIGLTLIASAVTCRGNSDSPSLIKLTDDRLERVRKRGFLKTKSFTVADVADEDE